MSHEVLYRFNYHDYFRCLWKLLFKKSIRRKKLKILVITPAFYLGGFLYLISAILNIYILKFLDYSVVLPLTSITYIWTFGLSYCFLKEGITQKKIIGIVLIVLGSIIIAV